MLDDLIAVTAGHAPAEGFCATGIDGVTIVRFDRPTWPQPLVMRPVLCVVLQGAKRTMFGQESFDYRAGKALVVSVEGPACFGITEASPETPYLSVAVEFDPAIIRELAEGRAVPPAAGRDAGVRVASFDATLADCVLRLMRLIDTPDAIPTIAPMIVREICYWLLAGPDGDAIARLALANSRAPRVAGAIRHLRERFAEPIRVDDLAALSRLSPSAFHRQFKAATTMTPVQYQKQLRLLEARRLMTAGVMNAETAAHAVGYNSPSQFSREFLRLFGTTPRRDAADARSISSTSL